MQIPTLCICLSITGGCLIYLGWLSYKLLLILLAILTMGILGLMVLERRAKSHLRMARAEFDHLVGHFRTLTEGAKELRLHRSRREAFFSNALKMTAEMVKQHNVAGGTRYAMLGGINQVLYFFVIGFTLLGVPIFISDISNRVLVGYALTLLYMRGPLITIIGMIPTFGMAKTSLEKVEALGLVLSFTDSSDIAPVRPASSWHRVDLSGVTHSYYSEEGSDSFILGPIDMRLVPGEVIFVVGANGSGKTTLAKLMTGLYAPESGEISIDGERVEEANRDHYRQYFSAVFADFYLFDHLLGLGDSGIDEQANRYIEQLQLSHKVRVVEGKLSTTELSYGQRKRLALLTALLEDRPIYVFDEWAAGQDPLFKELFYVQFLPELRARGKTVVVISHDDRYFHVADRIVKLEYGRIEFDKNSEARHSLSVPGESSDYSALAGD